MRIGKIMVPVVIISTYCFMFNNCYSLDLYEPADRIENSDILCSDGLDNDTDGFVDCHDFDCSQSHEITVCQKQPENTESTCQDNWDNDQNGYTDCNDRSCHKTQFCLERLEINDEKCSDGIDNDENGYTDCQDFSCSKNPEVTVCAEE